MIVFGFNDIQGRLNLRWQGFTLRWYRELFAIPGLTTALRNSLPSPSCRPSSPPCSGP
jgi:spermidine/putrescine transport system permease protein